MNELLVNAQVNLFAYIALQSDSSIQPLAEIYTEVLFSRLVNPKVGKIQKENFRHLIHDGRQIAGFFDIENICNEINRNTSVQQRLILLINLLEFGLFVQKNALIHSKSSNLFNLIEQISHTLKISESVFNLCNSFVSGKLYDVSDRSNLLVVKSENPNIKGVHFVECKKISGYLVFVYIPNISAIFFRYFGNEPLWLNSKPIQPKAVYVFQSGSVISLNGKAIIYFSDIIGSFKGLQKHEQVYLKVKNVEFTYPKSQFGLHNLSFTANSGELVGVMGGSGVGKSTLFNLLNGTFVPKRGSVSLNGIDYRQGLAHIQELIGFVPQDDSLFENLTVFENLYYTAKLALGNLNDNQILELVNARLAEFGLFTIRNLKVGSSVSRNISGGQRKRLNIVSEIIREPKILLVDEPTSGLSSNDSYRVMTLLKEQALSGRLVVVNIHQPSAEIYRLFDKILVLDQGGYMVYYGNPLEAIKYFKTHAGRIDSDEVECSTCHNVKPDEIFDIIDEKQVDEFGQFTEVRKVFPIDWSSKYIPADEPTFETKTLPPGNSNKANTFKQFSVFLQRLVFSKIRDFEFFIFAIVIPVLLATLIALFSKYSAPNESGGYTYIFYENYNIPIFFLTSIIACLFLGMIVTSDSIIKDAAVNKRERLLFLSRKAYYNSKVVFYFGLTLLQTLIYTAISVYILKIKGMFIELWLVLLIMGFFGNIAGLIVSTIFKSLSAAYLIVPFLVIPQIILSGITIPFDRMNRVLSHPEYVPAIGLASPSMWGMEALLVYQFSSNEYEKNFFKIDLLESQNRIKSQYLIPKIFQLVDKYLQSDQPDERYRLSKLINDGCKKLQFGNVNLQNRESIKGLQMQLHEIQQKSQQQYSRAIRKKDEVLRLLSNKLGGNLELAEYKQKYTNKGVEDLALARKNITAIQTVEDRIVQTVDPIFLMPTNSWGRAQFLAPYKRIGDLYINTFTLNILVLIIFLLALYQIFLFDIIPSFIGLWRYRSKFSGISRKT